MVVIRSKDLGAGDVNTQQRLFLVPGRSGFAVCTLLRNNSRIAPCHALHYLQMATEMLGKAYVWKFGPPAKLSHPAFVRSSCFAGRWSGARFDEVCKGPLEVLPRGPQGGFLGRADSRYGRRVYHFAEVSTAVSSLYLPRASRSATAARLLSNSDWTASQPLPSGTTSPFRVLT
jgi:hypothetical protein